MSGQVLTAYDLCTGAIPGPVFTVPSWEEEEPLSYHDQVVADGAIAYWPLDEVSGTTAMDRVGTRHGTISGGVTLGVAGVTAGTKAMAFDGTGSVNAAALPQLPATTYEGWLWFSVVPPVHRVWFLRDPWGTVGVELGLIGGPPSYLRYFLWGLPGGPVYFGAALTVSAGVWHHVVATHDGTTASLFWDGLLIGTVAATLVPDTGPLSTVIGNSIHDSNANWIGRIAEVSVYPTALTLAQVATHYARRLAA